MNEQLPDSYYPWEYTDAQGFHFPRLRAVAITDQPGFVKTVDPSGEVRMLWEDRMRTRDGMREKAMENLNEVLQVQIQQHNPYLDIVNFHQKMGLGYDGPPRTLAQQLDLFRHKFIEEEHEEFCDAETDAKKFDACLDMVYVIYGYMYLRGWNVPIGWERVHQANMRKVRAKDSGIPSTRQCTEWDVVKPEGWVAPDLSDLVVRNDITQHI